MSPFLVGILVPLGAFTMVFGIFYLAITSRNRERMALIERGADPTLFEAKKSANNSGIFKWGLFLVGIGFGIVAAYFLSNGGAMDEDTAYPAMIFIFGGISLILAFLWQRNEDEKEAKKELKG